MITLTPLTAGVLAGVIALCGIAIGALMAKAFDESQWGPLCTCGHHEMAHAKSGTCCFRDCKCKTFNKQSLPRDPMKYEGRDMTHTTLRDS